MYEKMMWLYTGSPKAKEPTSKSADSAMDSADRSGKVSACLKLASTNAHCHCSQKSCEWVLWLG